MPEAPHCILGNVHTCFIAWHHVVQRKTLYVYIIYIYVTAQICVISPESMSSLIRLKQHWPLRTGRLQLLGFFSCQTDADLCPTSRKQDQVGSNLRLIPTTRAHERCVCLRKRVKRSGGSRVEHFHIQAADDSGTLTGSKAVLFPLFHLNTHTSRPGLLIWSRAHSAKPSS